MKLKLAVIFGGMSTEHEISCISGASVIKSLNKDKYDICSIYIDKDGRWFEVLNIEENEKRIINNIIEFLKNFDIVFPVLHGLYGEDGTIQGLFELLKIPYVGCGVLSSSIGMDKVYSKIIFEKAQINQSNYIYVKKYNDKYIYISNNFDEKILELKDILNICEENLKYPMFVKPSNSGSSVGINMASNKEKLKDAIMEAGKFDKKILIEQGIKGKEVECAVLGNEEIITSCVGEIKVFDKFYSYDAKYNSQESEILIPANISEEKSNEIKVLAEKAFKAIDGRGFARVDFFVEDNTDKVYINEINTMPGFTNISMYPKLFDKSGIKYESLLDKMIEISLYNY